MSEGGNGSAQDGARGGAPRAGAGTAPEVYRAGGLAFGVLGIGCALFILGYGIIKDGAEFPAWAYPACLLVALAFWLVLVRPAVILGEHDVTLRNPLHSRHVPYAAISSVDIAQMTTIRTGDQLHVGVGLGRSRRTIRRDAKLGDAGRAEDHSLGWLVEQKVERRLEHVRRDVLPGAAAPEVRREWAWPEVGALGVLAVATLVLLLVG